MTDSKQLLVLEAKINESVQSSNTNNVFLMLTAVLTAQEASGSNEVRPTSRHLAGVVLKNMLKNHLPTLKQIAPEELDAVKQTLFVYLTQQPALSLEGPKSSPARKVVKEVILILCKICVTEFNHNSDDNALLTHIFEHFCKSSYNPVTVRLVYQILKEADDDRMNEFAGPLLRACFGFMGQEVGSREVAGALRRDTKLLQVVIFCFQSM